MYNHTKKYFNRKKGQPTEGIEISQITKMCRKAWYIFLLFPFLTLFAAWVYLRYHSPVYKVSSTILLKDIKNKQGISASDLIAKELGQHDKQMLGDEIKILSSYTVLEQVAKELNLDRTVYKRGRIKNTELYGSDCPISIEGYSLKDSTMEFKALLDIKDAETFQLTFADDTKQDCPFGKRFSTRYGDFLIHKNATGSLSAETKFVMVCKSFEKTAKEISQTLDIEVPKKESNILEPTLKSRVPEKAKDILQKMVSVYNKINVSDRNEVSKNTLSFIENRLMSLTDELSGVEHHVEQYKTKEGITSDGNSDIGYFFNRLGEYDKELIKFEVQNSLLNSIEVILKKGDNSYELLPTNLELKSTGLQNQIGEYNKMVLERNRLLKIAGDSNPVLKSLTEDLKNLKTAIVGNISRVKDENNAFLVQTKSKNVQFTNKLVSTPRKERELTDIKRQQNIKEGLYLFLLQKKEETAITIASTLSDARVIVRPIVGETSPYSKKKVVYLIALLLGLLASTVYVIFRFLANNTVQSEEDITKKTDMPILGKIPFCKTKQNLVIETGTRTAMAEMFRLLRADLQFRLQEISPKLNGRKDKGQVVMVTCTTSGEGKSFVSLNLGMSLALTNKKTVIIGLDLRRPKITEYLSIPLNTLGISDYLQSGLDANDIIMESGKHPDLFFIPSGQIPQNPAELIMNPQMGELITNLRDRFEYIIIDTPPIGLVSDALLLKPYIDMTLYIVRYDYTKIKQLDIIEKFYEGKKLTHPTILFNSVDWKDTVEHAPNNSYYYTKEIKPVRRVLNNVTSLFFA